ncbi:hypothetical protein [Deinococcus ruber]|uniref:hypothetical protein n=1 Tax=Deinococcus ruber TaxID=1848197 RepID=UPI0016657C69|nr:hypothetical protein [Deinococcus ruber]
MQWRVSEEGLSFVRWPVRAVKVGTRLTLQADAPKAEQTLPFVPLTGPDPYPLDRWAGVPFDAQVAALVEAIYIERIEVAELGAFTNVDVLAWRGDTRLSVEVKVRTRQAEADPADLRLTDTQLETMLQLRNAGWPAHFVVLSVPEWQRTPQAQLAAGTWHSCHTQATRSALNVTLEVKEPLVPLSVRGLLRARARYEAAVAPEPTTDVEAAAVPKRPTLPHPKRARTTRGVDARPAVLSPGEEPLDGPPRIVAFTGEHSWLHPAHPHPVTLGGRRYPSALAAFLAARTLDPEVREALTQAVSLERALRVCAGQPERAGWGSLRMQVVEALFRTVFSARPERLGSALLNTFPALLVDQTVEHPFLVGLRGPLAALTQQRAVLAHAHASAAERPCLRCSFALESKWPGFVGCAVPGGQMATRTCTDAPLVFGPAHDGAGKLNLTARLLPLTATGTHLFRPGWTSIEESAFRRG